MMMMVMMMAMAMVVMFALIAQCFLGLYIISAFNFFYLMYDTELLFYF